MITEDDIKSVIMSEPRFAVSTLAHSIGVRTFLVWQRLDELREDGIVYYYWFTSIIRAR